MKGHLALVKPCTMRLDDGYGTGGLFVVSSGVGFVTAEACHVNARGNPFIAVLCAVRLSVGVGTFGLIKVRTGFSIYTKTQKKKKGNAKKKKKERRKRT